VGFLPRKGGRRRAALEEIANERGATILFEAPNRIGVTLAELAEQLGPTREAALCRELTKLHAEVVVDDLSALAGKFQHGVRGEITLIISAMGEDRKKPSGFCSSAGRESKSPDSPRSSAFGELKGSRVQPLPEQVGAWQGDGLSTREISQRLAEWTGLTR